MRFVVKLLISLCIIIFCTQVGRKLPTLAGLIAVMPLTGAIVLVWLYVDNPGSFGLMTDYTKGALWGILPSILFFLVAFCVFASIYLSGLCFVQVLRSGLLRHLFISCCLINSS